MHTTVVVRTALQAPLRAVGISWFSLIASIVAFVFATAPLVLMAPAIESTDPLTQASPLLASALLYQGRAFVFAGVLLLIAAGFVRSTTSRYCPPDPEHARQYRRIRHWNRWVLRISATLWLIGIIAAYIVPSLDRTIGG